MNYKIIFPLLVVTFLAWNCESDTQQNESTTTITTTDEDGEEINIEINNKEDLFDALHTMLDKVEERIDEEGNSFATSDKDTDLDISYQDLQDELPLMISGMLRQDVTGDRNGIGKFQVANANARYETDDRSIDLGITYVGGLPFARMGEKWLKDANIVHEEEGEKAQTTTIDGYTAFESYNERKESGSVAVFVDDRFIVHAKGKGMSERALRKAVTKVDLDDLAKW
ncbi:MAG: hypothetical protein AAGI23_05665 [Bacteroidota bacterium]